MQLFGGPAAPGKDHGSSSGGSEAVIRDGSIGTFAQDVIQESMRVPVLVDFWAPWCGPCKQLTPVLEKVVKAAKGKVRLVKINIDENPELAQQMRVQSVPTVYAFVSGQPVTGFAGAQSESQVKSLIEKLTGGPLGAEDADATEAAREAMEAGDLQSAAGIYGGILQQDPENPDAVGGMARCLIMAGQLGEARRILDAVPAGIVSHAAVAGARAALDLAVEAGDLGDPRELEARVQRDAADHEARYRLATSLFLRDQVPEAMEQLLQIIRKEREWNEEAARKQLVRFFEALGPTHPQTLKGRRMLSSVLFS
ncbi:MAG: thioredoxin [Geminicoccaceae bacterium]|nr:thioredoxin [Geminicoccaceae bacterium]MCB9944135.1 thioredoxin [Geminicoccaceae bacterium]